MQRLLAARAIQPKLTVNKPGDEFEREADRVADHVMRMADSGARDAAQIRTRSKPTPIQRMCAKCKKAAEEPAHIQRMCSECEELHRKQIGTSETSSADLPNLETKLAGIRAGGQPLSETTRAFFEPRFGRDFRDVRVHMDARAAETARSIDALAYTTGRHIVFGRGHYAPETQPGKRLLAHELAHTVQQGESRPSGVPAIQRLGDLSKRPSTLPCPLPPDSPNSVINKFVFANGSTTLSATDKTDIESFVVSWNAAGINAAVRVDGYASPAGGDKTNWVLSCDRAMAVVRELSKPVPGKVAGIPPASIEILAHGETSEFSNVGGSDPDGPNRRATISSSAAIPTTPPSQPPTPTPLPSLCPAVPTTTPATCLDRNAGYCDAKKCFPGNSWLTCVCDTSFQICQAIDAFNLKGSQGMLAEACIDMTVGAPANMGAKIETGFKGKWFLDTNQCIWGHWRAALDALHDPTRPIPTTLTAPWTVAVGVCRSKGIGSAECCKAQVDAEQQAIDTCGAYDSARFGSLPTDVPFSPVCSLAAQRVAPPPPFTGDFGKVADRITYGKSRCCP